MINVEDDCSVGESVKMRGRWMAEEQRRKAAAKLSMLKLEELRIAKMKSKLDRRKRKDERKRRDRERMERGNRELKMNKLYGEESFLEVQPLNSSTQKTVMFNKELTKIRNISPVGSENQLEFNDKMENNVIESIHTVDISSFENEILLHTKKSVQSFESQQVFLPTQHTPKVKSRRKRKASKLKVMDKLEVLSPRKNQTFDAQLGAQSLLLSGKMDYCEFSLPKEFTSLKLEKIRENRILSQSLLGDGQKRKIQLSDSDCLESPERKVKSSRIVSKRLERTPCKKRKKVIKGNPGEVNHVLFDKCTDGQFSVIACVFDKNINVWVSHLRAVASWIRVGQFNFETKLLTPFLIIDRDTIRIKSFYIEKNQLKETSFVILGDSGDFSDSVTSTQNVLVLTETVPIVQILVEKYDSQQVISFHNMEQFSRCCVISYQEEQIEIKFLATLQGSTLAAKRLDGSDKLFLSFLSSALYVWDIKRGCCVRIVPFNIVDIDPSFIFCVTIVSGLIHFLHFFDEKFKITVLSRNSFKELVSYSVEEPLLNSLDSHHSSMFHMNQENMCLFVSNLCFKWNLKDKLINSCKIRTEEDFHNFLPLMN